MKTTHAVYSSLLALTMSTSDGYAKDESNFSGGLVNVSSASIYANVGSKSRTMPSLSYDAENIRVSVQEGLTYKLLDGPTSKLHISIAPNFYPYNSSASPDLSGMKRKMYFDGSLAVSYKLNRGLTARLKFAMEISSEFNGNAADLSLSQYMPVSGVPVILRAGSKWYDSSRSEYIYGVYSSETTGLRSQYAPGNVFVPYLGLNTVYNLTEQMSLFASINASFLPKKVKDSPIVSKQISRSLIVGLGYKF
jgi:outer membrane scaffolding protein for murein synthesis (MipA/OmpV family)